MSVVDISNSSLTPLEELPRATQSNPLGFDELTLARREREIANIMKDYPNVPPKFIETAWDFVATSKSEEDALEEVKRWDKTPAKPRNPIQVDI
jgi:hypothetical protein